MSSASSPSDDNAVLVGPGDIQDFNADNILPLAVEDLSKIRKWLQPTPYDLERSEFNRHLASHLAGTGSWLTSTTSFQRWHNGDDNGCLWIKGIPGSGKSVMAASIIHKLRQEGVPVLYFFFRQIIDANHQPVAALRDWLCQILPYSPPLQARLKDDLRTGYSLDSLSPSKLWKDLKFALSSLSKVYCVTDALDEMDKGNDGFLHALVDLGQWRPSNVKVLLTSRPVVGVENALRPFSIPQIRLEERLVDIDIAAYVQYRLRNSSVPQEYWRSIAEAIPGRANGLFLYAKLSMDAFVEPGADAREVLESLPADLNVVYNDLLREHARRSNIPDELQLLVLQIVTHATRSLRLLEIAEMVNTTHVSDGDRSLKETKDLVRSACGPLLEVLLDETVSVVHHSFTEFLRGSTRSRDSDDSSAYPVLRSGPTNKRLAVACLDYLRSDCLEGLIIARRTHNIPYHGRKNPLDSEIRLQFPFLEYAAENWYTHTRRAVEAGTDMSFFYEILDAFSANPQRFKAWLDTAWPKTGIEGLTPLHVAAWTGLAQYAAHLFQREGIDADIRDKSHRTPLYWAANSGNADVARVLLANGADPDAEQNEGYKPLHIAAGGNRYEVVEVLLAAGVDPLTPKTKDILGENLGSLPSSIVNTPLEYACNAGDVKTVAEFLPFLKDSDPWHHALYWASRSGHTEVVDLILGQRSVNVNEKYNGTTFLFEACRDPDARTIEVLLRAGADPNILCDDDEYEDELYEIESFPDCRLRTRRHYEPRGFTALHAFCRQEVAYPLDLPKCLQLLLEAGADIHVKAMDGSTAFHYACACEDNVNLIKPLLEAGADPALETDAGTTPLHTNGMTDKELLPVLLGTGRVDINKATSKTGWTPLHSRIVCGHDDAILAFMEYKPNVNATDVNGNSPLHMALESWKEAAVIDALLSAGADPNLQNREGDTPLHTMQTDCKYVPQLLNAGANLEIQNRNGQTPLFKFTRLLPMTTLRLMTVARQNFRRLQPYNTKDDFQILIDKGARLDTRDYEGRTLLHQCCHDANRLDHLIGLGLDPNITDYQGNTLFHEVAAREFVSKSDSKVKALQHLSDLRLDIDKPNYHRKTVLHILCAKDESTSDFWHMHEQQQPLDFVLRVCENPSPRDLDGVQPLHFAATISEGHVFRLLNAKADVFGVTNEGMTVLHIAARARQPGVISLVLSRLVSLDEANRKAFINQKDVTERAALHYACRSGRPETVKVLLENGADPNLSDGNGFTTPFEECANFETEQGLWNRDNKQCRDEVRNAAGVLLNDMTRPFWGKRRHSGGGVPGHLNTEQDTTRLEEILDLLILYGAAVSGEETETSPLQCTFKAAVSNQHDYTVDCLSRLNNRITDANSVDYSRTDADYLTCTYRLEAVKRAMRESGKFDNIETSAHPPREARLMFMEKLIALRYYDIFEEYVSEGFGLPQTNWPKLSLLREPVRFGYSDLLARFCTHDAVLKLDDDEWYIQTGNEESLCDKCVKPLLLTACERSLPNMEVVDLLVEKFGVNIDGQERECVHRRCELHVFHDRYSGSGALHKLALGQCWWHVDEALPYLIKKAANLELRNAAGQTPLHMASNCLNCRGPFSMESAKLLIESGADVNAADAAGRTCLSMAGQDLEMVRLLLSYGATVSAAALCSAIEWNQVEFLELLLCQGDYANVTQSGPEGPQSRMLNRVETVRSEVSPLLYAATFHNANEQTRLARLRIMTALVNHGADPYATFVKHHIREVIVDNESDSGSLGESAQIWVPDTCTVIHEILSGDYLSEPLFQLPFLQLEHRDGTDCSLLLAAFKGYRTPSIKVDCPEGVTKTIFQELMDRGADATAQDNDGKTILHHTAKLKDEVHFSDTLKAVITQNPGLVHQPDQAGDTPLHYALREHAFAYIDLLLQNGADPLQADSEGDTALHRLAEKLSTDQKASALFKRSLETGVDINTRDKEGNTPLLRYMRHGFMVPLPPYEFFRPWEAPREGFSERAFEVFQEAGADFLTCNDYGISSLHLLASTDVVRQYASREAAISEVVQRFKFLMDLGLDPMAEDAQQRTSLDVAAACGNEHVLKLFKREPVE